MLPAPTDPAPSDPAPPDPAPPSSWQQAQEVWQESGVTWERPDADTSGADPAPAWARDDEPRSPADADQVPALARDDEPRSPADFDSAWLEPPDDADGADFEPAAVSGWTGYADPGPWPPGPAADGLDLAASSPGGLDSNVDNGWAADAEAEAEDARPGGTWFTGLGPADQRVAAAHSAARDQVDAESSYPGHFDLGRPGPVPVAAEGFGPSSPQDNGAGSRPVDRPGGPGSSPTRPEPITADSAPVGVRRRVAPEDAGRPGRGRPWQPPQPGSGWTEYPATGFPGQAWPAGGGRAPLGAPVALDERLAEAVELATALGADGSRDTADPGWPGGASLTEPDELFRAWQGSVNEAAAGRGPWSVTRRAAAATRRRRALQAAAIGVPVAVIVTVGAGALMMLTGKANEMLAVRGDTGTPSSAASATGTSAAGATAQPTAGRVPPAFAQASLPGYPGQRGALSVAAMTAAAGVVVAVGLADGHPAIWRQAGNGGWTLESAGTMVRLMGSAGLTSIAHGPAGWIAVGATADGTVTAPMVYTSADGANWQAGLPLFDRAGAGTEFLGAAANGSGYVVVGRQTVGGRTFAVLWYSTDLRAWTEENNGGLDGRLQGSTASAVAATADGFIAVGSHGAAQAIWSSPDGRAWQLGAMSPPAGATSATLSSVAVSGTRVVAGGYAATRAGDIPIVVTTSGGGQWRQTVLSSPDGLGVITALTATPSGFTAAGVVGQGDASSAVTWTSPDGLTWSRPARATGSEITALTVDGSTLVGSAVQGTATTLVPLPTQTP